MVALSQRSLLAGKRGDQDGAEALAQQANQLVSRVQGGPARTAEHAANAHALLHRGRWNEARTCLTAAQDLLPCLTVAIPWLAVLVRIELGRGFVTLRDGPAAQELLSEIDEMLVRVPGLGTLAALFSQGSSGASGSIATRSAPCAARPARMPSMRACHSLAVGMPRNGR